MRFRSGTRLVVTSLAMVGFLFIAVFPTRTFFAQRGEIARASERLAVLGEQNRRLESQVDRLERDEEIERLARAEYNLVRPGEEAYAIVSPPAPSERGPRPVESRRRPGSPLTRLVARIVSGIL